MSEYILNIPDYVPPFDPAVRAASLGEEVVRCRDCEWFGEDKSDHEYRSGWWCDRLDFDTIEYGFCHLGERRAE